MSAGSWHRDRFSTAGSHDEIVLKVDKGLTAQRIWQDLMEEFGSWRAQLRVGETLRAASKASTVTIATEWCICMRVSSKHSRK